MINRKLSVIIQKRLLGRKAQIILGPRQVGKTTMLRELVDQQEEKCLWLNGDDLETRDLLKEVTTSRWKRILGDARILVVDEAQRIENAGLKLKLITDQIPEVSLLVSGSSALELGDSINEPLTGRKWQYQIFPLSFAEMQDHHGYAREDSLLEERLIYGYYPDVVNSSTDALETLRNLTDSYLFKDVLALTGIRRPEKLTRLLQALAYQLGNEVSYHELGKLVDLDNQTVESYISLLERAFIIYRLQPLSRNLRKELKTKRKIYFYDNGIRNAVIGQFQPLSQRQDIGALWENFLLSERRKVSEYDRLYGNYFFWRTKDQQEIDYVEERDGKMHAFEFKFSAKRTVKFPKAFLEAYPQHTTAVINRQNYADFVAPLK